jgi:M6 family metalloprotease-like protein
MKKRLYARMAITLGAVAALSGCALGSVAFLPYGFAPIAFEQSGVVQENYYRPEAYSDDYNSMLRTHPVASQRRVPMSSRGAQKVLVIPVDFVDYRADRLDEGETASRLIIQNAFFGRPETTQWESVASFYHKSSYGQLELSGRVSQWYSSPESVADLISSGSKTVATERILKAAVTWYKGNYSDAGDYDQDGDGYLDSVFLVYAAPYRNNESVFWAFTSFDTGLDGANYLGNPIGNAYVWASYHFLNVYRQKGDPHTFIHEFGHLLGLTDYYNTSALPSTFPDFSPSDSIYKRYQYTYGPTGKVDMMDYSIGDHTVLSKMLLDWVRPYVVTGPGKIDIAPLVSSGEAIIVAPDWSGKAFDEYLAIEFYAPTKLNYVDSERAYGHDSAHLMGHFGIKVYHVDARASYHRSAGDAFIAYEDQGPELDLPSDVFASGAYYRQVAHTNTYATTVNENLIYRLLEKGGSTTFLTGSMATNDILLNEGDSFGIGSYQTFTFNDGTPLPWAFTVEALDRYEATLSFVAI